MDFHQKICDKSEDLSHPYPDHHKELKLETNNEEMAYRLYNLLDGIWEPVTVYNEDFIEDLIKICGFPRIYVNLRIVTRISQESTTKRNRKEDRYKRKSR